MTTQPFKAILLDLLRQSQLDEDTFLQELNEGERNAIGTPELWSVKDHIAHTWLRYVTNRLKQTCQSQDSVRRFYLAVISHWLYLLAHFCLQTRSLRLLTSIFWL